MWIASWKGRRESSGVVCVKKAFLRAQEKIAAELETLLDCSNIRELASFLGRRPSPFLFFE